VLAAVHRDRHYHAASGGGATLSGGEPLAQPEFAEALLHAAKAESLHCRVETSGMSEWIVLERWRLFFGFPRTGGGYPCRDGEDIERNGREVALPPWRRIERWHLAKVGGAG